MKAPAERLLFAGRQEWRTWLSEQHATASEAWVLIRKKASQQPGLPYEDAVEEALCFGWIDGMMHAVDAGSYVLRFSPRKPGSIWAESNKRRVEKLIADSRMTQAGLAAIVQARTTGMWDAVQFLADVTHAPADLEQALAAEPGALTAYAALAPSLKQQLLWWIARAKREDTRRRRIAAVVQRAVRERRGTELGQ